MSYFQRVTSILVILALALPVSTFAESRSRQRTDLGSLAEELRAVLGSDAVEIRSSRAPSRERSNSVVVRTSGLSARALVEEMNLYRAEAGLPPLRLDQRLSRAASDRISDMFEQRYFNHVAPDGTQPFVWVRRHSYRYSYVGENLAAGFPSARQVVAGWMRSPGHRANIMSGRFDDVGLALSNGFPGRNRISGPTVVALYAREM